MNKSSAVSVGYSKPRMMFELHPVFQPDRLDMIHQELFPKSSTEADRKNYSYANFTHINNRYLENEIKGFIQHLALDLHYASATLKQYITQSMHTTTLFMNEKYPECNSISELPFDRVYAEYVEYLSDMGMSLISYSIRRVDASMDTVNYPCKTHYISGFVNFYKYIFSVAYPNDDNEYDKNIWDIRKLGIPFNTAVSRTRYTINFTCIQQDWFRSIVKEYAYYRLQNKTVASVIDDLKALRIFSEFLIKEKPCLTSLKELDRNTIEEYYKFLNSKGFVTTTYNHRISALRTFFYVCNMLDIDEVPQKPIIMYSDYRKIPHNLPKCFSDSELKQMNEHIGDLPIQIGRMFFVLENCGMRVSDICSSTIYIANKHCLEKNTNGDFVFTYYMPKTHKYNTIPVSEIVGNVILEAISESQTRFGNDCKYIFSQTKDRPISVETFSLQMNNMSAKYNLTKDDGTPLRIKGHTFRGTLATQYANCGIGMDVIRMMLGQEKIGVLKHYVKIHSDTMLTYMKPILNECDRRIRGLNDDSLLEEDIAEPALIPLPNGRCSKNVATGICTHANNCYDCRMFCPSKEHIEVYKKQLRDAENNIAVAELHGYDRIKEINVELREKIIKIIQRIEGDE